MQKTLKAHNLIESHRMKQILFIVAIFWVLLTSCSNGCEETRESYCLADLTSSSGAKINLLYAYGIGQGGVQDSTSVEDEVMLTASSPSSLEFILNPDTTFTDIRLQMNITLDGDAFQYTDTLHFEYIPHPYFLDMECGCSMYFSLNNVTSTNNFIRSVTLKRKEITNEENTNIIIEY